MVVDQPVLIDVRITGFGPFSSIVNNPSAVIAENVAQKITGECPFAQVFSETLKVSVQATESFFLRLEKEWKSVVESSPPQNNTSPAYPPRLTLLCHFGVNSSEASGRLKFEVEGFNELHASIPDMDGVVYSNALIDDNAGPLSFSLVSAFADDGNANSREKGKKQSKREELEHSIAAMNKELAIRAASAVETDTELLRVLPHWVISRNAGRYICNYTLFRGLQMEKKYMGKVFCVFIHVCNPEKEITDEEHVENRPFFKTSRETIQTLYNPSIEEQVNQCVQLVKTLITILCPSIKGSKE